MRTLSNSLARLLAAVLGTLLALLVVLAALETLAWTFFNLSYPQTSEISGILLTWFGFLAAAYAVKHSLHLRLELLTRRLPPRLANAIGRFAAALVVLFGVLMAVYGFRLTQTVTNTLPATGLGASIQYFPAAAGGLLMALFALEQVLFGELDGST
jgi:TRAP-type C4-dicarboxylate transport system permease small subunit